MLVCVYVYFYVRVFCVVLGVVFLVLAKRTSLQNNRFCVEWDLQNLNQPILFCVVIFSKP